MARPRIHQLDEDAANRFVGVKVPSDDVAQLDQLAAAKGTSRSDLIRQAIAHLLASPVDDEEVAA